MKKYLFRLFVALLAFSVGTMAIYLSLRFDMVNFSNPLQLISSGRVVHSSENNSPYSVLEGTTVRIKPYNATFEIPESWLTLKPAPDKHIKNLFISWQDLNEVNLIDNEVNGFDEEEAEVINSTLPFEDCAAHVGDKGWGNGLWNDLQGRVYVTNLTPQEVSARLKKQGLDKAVNIFERTSIKYDKRGEWEKLTLNIVDAPSWSDFILGENLDFYYRPFGNKTVVFVFLHSDRFDEEINLLLDSFKWSN